MKNQSLTFKFTLIFAAFIAVTLIISSFFTFFAQMSIYKKQKEARLQEVATYIEKVLTSDNEEFVIFNDYFIAHHDEFLIPIDFDWKDVNKNRKIYETLFAEQHPGKILGQTVSFDEFSDELKKAFTIYNFEYYRMLLDETQKIFGIAYAYYLVPSKEKDHMYWVLDALREPKIIDDNVYMNICIEVPNTEKEFPKMWEAWYTGKSPEGYHIYDNEYGKTYAYYRPFTVNEKRIGVIGVEVEISSFNRDILLNTLQQMVVVSIVLVISSLLLLFIIRTKYIQKLNKFSRSIEEYTKNKDVKITEKLSAEVTNKDEISTIIAKFSDMIYQLELYIQNLTKTKQDLKNQREQAIELNELSLKDPLTGIRNKEGYYKEVQKIEWEMTDDDTELGIAVIDIDSLQSINSAYGTDKGDVTLIAVSQILCKVFEHSPVFRLEDGKFAVILRDHDLEHIDDLIIEFHHILNERKTYPHLEKWEKPSATIGFATYNHEIDISFDNVLVRAEKDMKNNKKTNRS